ncbi:hypothetical protein HG535_0B00960 [Zygotorulaspora mrakii]|uniref:Small ribosomal subunit protein mS29 n=1 Tax=Zygotorulaspora mrakii TaxID=42260 RepID=A0A7H9AXB8_ZYGMR|nr:uncharacterized protein HG535_0B00960 [Zygotorulaspora mrakii]QLG71058.1 hypothetical protein HG535_0B00960 [Zygotorulaspora mrakii]
MLGLRSRQFSTTILSRAAAPSRGKAQGFAKKASGNKTATKRISGDTLYKNWTDTVASSKLSQNASFVEIPTLNSSDLNSTLNKVASYTNKQYRSLYHLGSFKKNQYNELFPKPISLVRESSTKKFLDLLRTSSNKKFIITGEAGVGKSVLLAQTHAVMCESKGIIIHISYPEAFLNGRKDFVYDETTKQYIQPMYLKQLLRKILKSNDEKVLRSLKLSKDYTFSNADPKDSAIKKQITLKGSQNDLFDLISVKTHSRNSGNLFQAIISELLIQKAHPVFFTIDNFSRILTTPFSSYKDVNNKNIHLLEFQIGKIIMDTISGDSKFLHRDSAVVLAISGVDRTNRTLPTALGKVEEDVYISRDHYDPEFASILKKGEVREFEVPKLTKDEVKELLEFYLKSEIILNSESQQSFERLADQKYFLSGNGNPRELLKSIVLMHS